MFSFLYILSLLSCLPSLFLLPSLLVFFPAFLLFCLSSFFLLPSFHGLFPTPLSFLPSFSFFLLPHLFFFCLFPSHSSSFHLFAVSFLHITSFIFSSIILFFPSSSSLLLLPFPPILPPLISPWFLSYILPHLSSLPSFSFFLLPHLFFFCLFLQFFLLSSLRGFFPTYYLIYLSSIILFLPSSSCLLLLPFPSILPLISSWFLSYILPHLSFFHHSLSSFFLMSSSFAFPFHSSSHLFMASFAHTFFLCLSSHIPPSLPHLYLFSSSSLSLLLPLYSIMLISLPSSIFFRLVLSPVLSFHRLAASLLCSLLFSSFLSSLPFAQYFAFPFFSFSFFALRCFGLSSFSTSMFWSFLHLFALRCFGLVFLFLLTVFHVQFVLSHTQQQPPPPPPHTHTFLGIARVDR
ncbi:uncharacterized protein LOC127007059 [Eriocheir sinensis]|uniref:uncharacterized protein LOC127007059 n=1 Tax=Eriocheir sinensis TaxID=95602 RepID=UPI0021C63563|nr:uncharacterized protein LOC127007059 [Eriocheir sinensis]